MNTTAQAKELLALIIEDALHGDYPYEQLQAMRSQIEDWMIPKEEAEAWSRLLKAVEHALEALGD